MLVKLKIKAGEGRHIFGHGAQAHGAVIEVEKALADTLIADDPAAYELVKVATKEDKA